ncbi:hypothetical protein BCR39DRAFT_161036 [Naematelia encephala]|uniref:Uncharacterized protein n=1 Tax=Naematelia encephala TaxID=71784 RepID=A0A1Y2B6L3_9TREE|nr:hypothetical protein BCR39DRAFT_161036 [Naematelia encephala]
MSTVEIPIETALQHAVARPSTSPKAGTKRKGRASVSGQRPSVNNARVTRRSALDGEAEPSRGEEENLIGHPSGGSTAKRRRQSSSRYNAQAEKINPNIDPALQDTGALSADAKTAGASSSQLSQHVSIIVCIPKKRIMV